MEYQEFIDKTIKQKFDGPLDILDALENLTHNYEIERCKVIKGKIIYDKLNVLNDLAVKINKRRFNMSNPCPWNIPDNGQKIICMSDDPEELDRLERETVYNNDTLDYVLRILEDKIINSFGSVDLISSLTLPVNSMPNISKIPEEFNTKEAKKYFKRAIKHGLMSSEYVWLKGLQLLALFAREMSLKLDLGKGQSLDGEPRISWKPFEILFRIEKGKLCSNYKDVLKSGNLPKGNEILDLIFKD